MKNIEWQVCSLEQAKKFKELGIAQNGLFTTVYDSLNERWGYSGMSTEALSLLGKSNNASKEYYSVFTAAELTLMIGRGVRRDRLWIQYCNDGCYCQVITLFEERITKEGETEAIAKANMLIHLIESGRIDIESINERLAEVQR
ncbi:hypothetical protein D3C80_691570 [compost metagenome]